MAAELEAPIDRLTGLAYCLLPPETSEVDQNHQMFHSDEPEFSTTGGAAVRHGRIQDVDIADHVVFHQRYDWVRIPQGPEEQFRYLAFVTADYIPPFALDVRRRKPWVQRLDPEQVKRMQSREVRIGSKALLGSFFSEYALDQEVGTPRQLEEFQYTHSNYRRRKLGGQLLTEALVQATDPLREDFRLAKKSGHMALGNFDRLPFLMKSMIGPRNRKNYIEALLLKLDGPTESTVEALQNRGDEVELAA